MMVSQEESPFPGADFQVFMLNFRDVIIWLGWHKVHKTPNQRRVFKKILMLRSN